MVILQNYLKKYFTTIFVHKIEKIKKKKFSKYNKSTQKQFVQQVTRLVSLGQQKNLDVKLSK